MTEIIPFKGNQGIGSQISGNQQSQGGMQSREGENTQSQGSPGGKQNWPEMKREIQKAWGKLSSEELEKTKGNMSQIGELIKSRYADSGESDSQRLNEIFKRSESGAYEANQPNPGKASDQSISSEKSGSALGGSPGGSHGNSPRNSKGNSPNAG